MIPWALIERPGRSGTLHPCANAADIARLSSVTFKSRITSSFSLPPPPDSNASSPITPQALVWFCHDDFLYTVAAGCAALFNCSDFDPNVSMAGPNRIVPGQPLADPLFCSRHLCSSPHERRRLRRRRQTPVPSPMVPLRSPDRARGAGCSLPSAVAGAAGDSPRLRAFPNPFRASVRSTGAVARCRVAP